MKKEIERKWLVNPELLPDLSEAYCEWVENYYLSLDPEIRVRKVKPTNFSEKTGWGCYITVKSDPGLTRDELETHLCEDVANALIRTLARGRTLKRRYHFWYPQGHTILIDEFLTRPDLWLAEVEFASVAAAERFAPPAFLGQEVTGDLRYYNRFLALP